MRTLLQRRLLPLHLFVLVAVATTVSLGRWQLARLAEVRAHNAQVSARLDDPPLPLDAVDLAAAPDRWEYTPVVVRGRYEPDGELRVRNRAHRGQNGQHVVTPLRLADGRLLLVDRGWVPPDTAVDTPDGEVTVTGLLRASQPPPWLGPKDPPEGVLREVFRIDLGRLAAQFDAPLVGAWLQLLAQDPPPGPLPIPAPPPELDEGPHLSYAIQWFALAGVAVATYAVFLRRRLREAR